MGGIFSKKGASGFSLWSTAEQVTEGINGTGLTAIVTGGSSGIGAKTCRVLTLCGVHVVMAVRNTAAGESVKETILEEIPGAKIDVREFDLNSLESERSIQAFQRRHRNAIATNHLGHFLLTKLLLKTMKSTSGESKIEGRIVNVSSSLHPDGYRKGIHFDKINDEAGYNRYYAYAQSKLANLLHTNELTRRLKQEGVKITASSLHPCMILTNIGCHDLLLSCNLHLLYSTYHDFNNNVSFSKELVICLRDAAGLECTNFNYMNKTHFSC
ncbi:hypothetical protein ACFX1R_015991 [Malus domestica]